MDTEPSRGALAPAWGLASVFAPRQPRARPRRGRR